MANFEGTVSNLEGTVAFINATDFLKLSKGVKFGEICDLLGWTRSQMDMTRIKRRQVSSKDIDKLIQEYPDVEKFFNPSPHMLEEPMQTRFYGKITDHRDELVELQKKMIEKLENELAETKEKLTIVEAERKTLIDIVSQRK